MAIAWINEASPDAQYDWNWISPAQLAEKKLQAVTTALEIPALKQAQRNIQTWLDRQAEVGASKSMLGALALGTAVNEVLLPTTAVDLLPLGKVGKIAKAAGEVERGLATERKIEITKAYSRPSGSTTPAQRKYVQGEPCVDCGDITPKQVADHKYPLVKEYYETGEIDKVRMRSTEAIQPQCPTCSARQGAELSRYSKEMKKEYGLDK